MNKKQAILFSLLLTFGAASANDNGDKVLNDDLNSKSGLVEPTALHAPAVYAGDVDDADDASLNKRMAIHVSGGKQGKMSAESYAKILANAFANREFTDKPMYITVTHEETGKDRGTGAVIYMDGVTYRYNGISAFTPEQIGGAIDIIAEDFVDKHGMHLVLPENVSPVVVASID